jgi:hypothetical protein
MQERNNLQRESAVTQQVENRRKFLDRAGCSNPSIGGVFRHAKTMNAVFEKRRKISEYARAAPVQFGEMLRQLAKGEPLAFRQIEGSLQKLIAGQSGDIHTVHKAAGAGTSRHLYASRPSEKFHSAANLRTELFEGSPRMIPMPQRNPLVEHPSDMPKSPPSWRA